MQKYYKNGRFSTAENLSRLLEAEIDEFMRSGSELDVTSTTTDHDSLIQANEKIKRVKNSLESDYTRNLGLILEARELHITKDVYESTKIGVELLSDIIIIRWHG